MCTQDECKSRVQLVTKEVGFWKHLKLYKKHRILECAITAVAIKSDKSYLDIHFYTNGYSWKKSAILHCNNKVWLLWALSSHEITTENELHIRKWSYFSTKWDILVRKHLIHHFSMKPLLKPLSIKSQFEYECKVCFNRKFNSFHRGICGSISMLYLVQSVYWICTEVLAWHLSLKVSIHKFIERQLGYRAENKNEPRLRLSCRAIDGFEPCIEIWYDLQVIILDVNPTTNVW